MKKRNIQLLVAALWVGVAPAVAADFDGSKPLVCATIETNDCAVGLGCLKGLAEDVNVPQFVRLDFTASTIAARGRTSKILNQSRANGMLTIQGIEHGRAFSITVSEGSGKLVGAIAGDEEGFVIFGACTPS